MSSSAGSFADDVGADPSRSADVAGPIEVQRGRPHPDEVPRRIRDRTVDAEHRQLEPLARPDVAPEDDAVRRVEALDQLAPGLSEHDGQPPVHPDFGVVVHHDIEHDRGAGRIERADAIRDGDLRPIPVEAQTPMPLARLELGRAQHRPSRVVEVGRAGVRRDVVRPIQRSRRSQVRSRRPVLDVDDPDVAVPPLALHEPQALRGGEVDDRRRPGRRRIRGDLRGDCDGSGGDEQRSEKGAEQHSRSHGHLLSGP